MALLQLILSPLRDSYNLTFGDDVVTTEYSDGMPRQRLDSTGRPHHTGIGFRNTKSQQDYLQAFWRINRAKPFSMQLLGDNTTLEWYECRFISPPNLKSLAPNVFDWSCDIVVKPKPLDIETDKTIVAIFEQTGGYTDQFFNLLEKLVNVELPNAIGGLSA
ncbi:hypothetical protein KZX29_04180 [Moraxella osloensis]|uniref:hypothetical protein n=1 Tax=Faucicola osloensis TaxID=34062 RepID=UPI0020052F18|nr:hypothetical protein [Moraxella osloensis]MCK6157994.1 hypothetical protein [Moraxella osloensis]